WTTGKADPRPRVHPTLSSADFPAVRKGPARSFTIWTLTARLPLGLKSDSRERRGGGARDRFGRGASRSVAAPGHGGMPDAIRARGVPTHPWRRRFGQAGTALWAVVLLPPPANADEYSIADYLGAIAALDRHELAALTLTLGVILFGVVTAIALLRTRART